MVNLRAKVNMTGERLITLGTQFGKPGELGRTFLENRVGPIEERVVPYDLVFDREGNPVGFKVGRDTEIKRLEDDGMRTMYKLAKMGYSHVFWLSPPGGPVNYPEGRLVVGIVKKVGEETILECRGIPIIESCQTMWEKACQLINMGGVVLSGGLKAVEDLREQAIGINLIDELPWDFCEEVFGMGEVWETIRGEEDLKRTREVVGVVGQVLNQIERRFGVVTQYNSIQAGIAFEQMMAVSGWSIRGGNHGSTNIGLSTVSSFNTLFSKSAGTIKPVETSGKRVCPYCGQVLENGATVCKKCGAKFE